jgi:hypothetical protein
MSKWGNVVKQWSCFPFWSAPWGEAVCEAGGKERPVCYKRRAVKFNKTPEDRNVFTMHLKRFPISSCLNTLAQGRLPP